MTGLTVEDTTTRPSPSTAAAPSRVTEAIDAARNWLFGQQTEAGYWVADFGGDATLEAYFVILEAFLGRRGNAKSLALAAGIREQVLPEGAWAQYPGGPAEITVSCLSYFALKLAGDSADAPHMQRSRDVILKLGGVDRANTYTKYHLALFGEYSWDDVPAIPAEMMFLPFKFPVNIYDMSSWSRTIFLPLAILYAHKPARRLPPEHRVEELFVPGAPRVTPPSPDMPLEARFWREFFFVVDRALKLYEKIPGSQRLRKVAVERAAAWMIQRFQDSDGLSAILPAMSNSVMALDVLGYAEDHPLMREQMKHIDDLLIRHRESQGVLRMQPCVSPVWDTVLSAHALVQSGVAPDEPHLKRAATWILSKQAKRPGDWSRRNPAAPGGWYFEYRNEFYPDNDDTCVALMALAHARADVPEEEQRAAMERGVQWMLGMQNRDGGWGAFDRNNDKDFLLHVPFADFNAMIDPSTADITSRVLESLSQYPGFGVKHPAVQRALEFLRRDQCADGSWYGRWGVNYMYGTWQVLRGMRMIGAEMQTPEVRRAVRWFNEHQNADGGWGESIASYDFPDQKGIGASTPSQTAWALMGLIAAYQEHSEAVQRGVKYLLDRQNDEGTWSEEFWTGTGFPKVYYMHYPMYRHYFPLMALSHYRTALGDKA
jgi:squalene-hopene/tetraprenyl-beta-curcumene cyclase